MKTKLLLFALFAISLSFVACNNNDDDNNNIGDCTADCLRAEINGEFWEASIFSTTNVTAPINTLILAGSRTTNGVLQNISITMLNRNPGSYNLDALGSDGTVVEYTETNGGSTTDFNQVSGTLTITESDTTEGRIKGTFQYEGVDPDGNSVSVTAGEFDILY